jgi:hypothetical protein
VKVIIAVVVVVLTLTAATATGVAISLHALDKSQHQWCETLGLLTQQAVPQPADPAANPSRERAYEFYTHLKTLEQRFGC